jgi:hypothetical protein
MNNPNTPAICEACARAEDCPRRAPDSHSSCTDYEREETRWYDEKTGEWRPFGE